MASSTWLEFLGKPLTLSKVDTVCLDVSVGGFVLLFAVSIVNLI